MTTAAKKQRPPLVQALIDTAIAGVIALIVFFPIAGILLDGYEFNAHPWRPINLTIAVMAGRFIFSFLSAKTNFKLSHGTKPSTHSFFDRHPKLLPFTLGLVFVLCLCIPFLASKYWLTVIILALIYVLLGLGLNIVLGLAGLLDLGFVAFYAVGAYGYALGYQYLGLGFWGSLPLAALMAACFGAVLGFPVLRMHGDYLAIVTLGFGEIIRLILNNWLEFTGGPNGIRAPVPSFMGLEFTRRARQGGTPFHEWMGIDYNSGAKYIFIYIVLFLAVAFTIYGVTRLKRMPIGRAWEALREDEIACRSLGLNHVTTKLSAFSMGASIGGIAGVFFASYQGFVNPSSFTFFESALIVAVVVLGGLGSTVGVIISAIVLTLLPELLREFAEFRILAFGVLMVLMMIWRPRGLIRSRRPTFERGAA